ncbi:hypothetical protein CDAR_597111 [Caerostris darwini]|uniref:Uncharacterized protein n=1 Tax=Caerostris darwini TaxID=1538125 RepID=A0AAV4U2B5_9ARAC|nr:hypothetical protein CDAR_597111 [Caerostris darwini]
MSSSMKSFILSLVTVTLLGISRYIRDIGLSPPVSKILAKNCLLWIAFDRFLLGISRYIRDIGLSPPVSKILAKNCLLWIAFDRFLLGISRYIRDIGLSPPVSKILAKNCLLWIAFDRFFKKNPYHICSPANCVIQFFNSVLVLVNHIVFHQLTKLLVLLPCVILLCCYEKRPLLKQVTLGCYLIIALRRGLARLANLRHSSWRRSSYMRPIIYFNSSPTLIPQQQQDYKNTILEQLSGHNLLFLDSAVAASELRPCEKFVTSLSPLRSAGAHCCSYKTGAVPSLLEKVGLKKKRLVN